jgi:CRP/FNR family transcriptional regulator
MAPVHPCCWNNFAATDMSPDLFFNYLKSYYPQLELTETQLRDAAAMIRFRTLQKGEQLIPGHSASSMYLLVNGKLKCVNCTDGEQPLVKSILFEGDVFGDLTLLNQKATGEYVQALVNNVVIALCSINDLIRYLQQHPSLAIYFAMNNGIHIKKQERRYLPLFQKDAKLRLLCFLRSWARSDGKWKGEQVILERYLTNQDIAGYICTSRQTIHSLLKELQEDGQLKWGKKEVVLQRDLLD